MLQGNGIPQQNNSPGLAALRVAQQIRARYGQHARRPPSVPRHWLRLRPAVAYLARHHHTHLAARLSLTVMALPLGSDTARPFPVVPTDSVRAAGSTAPAWQPRLLPVVVRSSQTLVQSQASAQERLLHSIQQQTERTQRWWTVERIGRQVAESSSSVPLATSPRLKPVPRVLRRATSTVQEAATGKTASPTGASFERGTVHGGSGTTQPPPLNIGDVTNQVLQQLDRRLQAHRERRGQV